MTVSGAALGAAFFVVSLFGCGHDQQGEGHQQPSAPHQASTQNAAEVTMGMTVAESDALKETVDVLRHKAFVATISINTQSTGIWSQDGQGSWRMEHVASGPAEANGPGTIIHNATEGKGWLIKGGIAYEITGADYLQTMHESLNPVTSVLMTAPARTGSGAQPPMIGGQDGIWEWRMSGTEHVETMTPDMQAAEDSEADSRQQEAQETEMVTRLEFQGPEGLLSLMFTTFNNRTVSETVEYSEVGSVSPDLFRLPPEVKDVRPYEDLMRGTPTS